MVDVVVTRARDHEPSRPRSVRDGSMHMDNTEGFIHVCDVVVDMANIHPNSIHQCHCGLTWGDIPLIPPQPTGTNSGPASPWPRPTLPPA